MYGNPQKQNWGWRKRKLLFIFFFLVVLLVLGGIVQFLWNTILPDLFTVKTLNYGQALGLLLLFRILFGNFQFSHRGGRSFYKNSRELPDKWRNMSEEERATFKEQWQKRCAERKQ